MAVDFTDAFTVSFTAFPIRWKKFRHKFHLIRCNTGFIHSNKWKMCRNVFRFRTRVLRLRQARNNLLEVHEGGHSLQDRVLGEVTRHGYACLQ